MTEHKTKFVEEPVGYDHPATERIPVQGELSDERVPADRSFAQDEEDRLEPDRDALERDRDGVEPDRDGLQPRPEAFESESDRPESDLDRPESLETQENVQADDYREPVAEPGDYQEPVAEPGDYQETARETTEAPATASAQSEPSEVFFDETAMSGFRDRWRELQGGFVDDPEDSVRGAGELVDEIMRELAERKAGLDERWRAGDAGTEELRVVIREYRAFFNRLLTD
ncbi:hypothetical protein [Actinophytocola oryzae]|uniref:Uncharacterized protein n=1 Tax=Actinophytocola oryzae TaxID=502181 RepID=A0A4R7VXU2_9PSEU|nr:hypothetical protein [Actinophytocola oryzae]TDV54973.1 hypothetical protein CLV71_103214 [Actinophytocola oryzae]